MRESNPNLKLIVSQPEDFEYKISRKIDVVCSKINSYADTKEINSESFYIQSEIDYIYYTVYNHIQKYSPIKLSNYIKSGLNKLTNAINKINVNNECPILLCRDVCEVIYDGIYCLDDKDDETEFENYVPYFHILSTPSELKKYLESQKDNPKFDINLRDSCFRTALDKSIESNDCEIVKILFKYGAKPTTIENCLYSHSFFEALFASNAIFKIILKKFKTENIYSKQIELYLKKYIITFETKKNLNRISNKNNIRSLLLQSIETNSNLLLEFFLTDKTTKNILKTKIDHNINIDNYDALFFLMAYKDISLPEFKYVISYYPKNFMNISLRHTRNSLRVILINMIVSKVNLVYYKFLIQVIIKQTKLTSLVKLRKLFKGLTSNPAIETNPLITALSLGQADIAELLLKYGAETPKIALTGDAYHDDSPQPHPAFYSLATNKPQGIKLLYKYGFNLLVYNKETKKNLLHYFLSFKKTRKACISTLYSVLLQSKGFINSVSNDLSYVTSALTSNNPQHLHFVLKNKLYNQLQAETTSFDNSIEIFKQMNPKILDLLSSFPKLFNVSPNWDKKLGFSSYYDTLPVKILRSGNFRLFLYFHKKYKNLYPSSFPPALHLLIFRYCWLKDENKTKKLRQDFSYAVKYLLQNSDLSSLKDSEGQNILHEGIGRGLSLKEFKLILQSNENLLLEKDKKGKYPISEALIWIERSYKIVIYLVKKYGQRLRIIFENNTDISRAIWGLKEKKIIELIEALKTTYEINCIRIKDSVGNFPVRRSLMRHRSGQYLLEYFHVTGLLDIDALDDQGNTLLHEACAINQIKYILKHSKHNLHTKNYKRVTPFEGFCKHFLYYRDLDKTLEILDFYKDNGYDIAKPLPNKNWPVLLSTYSFSSSNVDRIGSLHEVMGVDFKKCNYNSGNNFLLLTAKSCILSTLVAMLNINLLNSDCNLTNKEGDNMLHIFFKSCLRDSVFLSCKNWHEKNFRELILCLKKHNFDFYKKNKTKKTPYDYLKMTADKKILSLYPLN